jgi:hypothetical protein
MVAALATIFLSVANAQAKVNESCDLSVFSVSETKTFLQFDKELRTALAQGDAAKMALLSDYPLRVGDYARGYLIPDPASLQGHFDKIFPPSLRKQLASEPFEKIWCNYTGITYSNGVLWVQPTDHGYRLHSINLPPAKKLSELPPRRVELVCRTSKTRAVVDAEQSSRESRLRLWDIPHSLDAKPDIDVRGVEILEGTGPCAHAYYKFEFGNQIIQIDDARGCSSGEDAPPKDAVAQITTTDAKGKDTSTWCY